MEFLEKNPEYAGSFHETQTLSEDGTTGHVYGRNAPDIVFAIDTITDICRFHTSSFLFRNDSYLLPDCFFCVFSGDMALFSIVAAKGPLKKLPEVMSVYRKHSGGMTYTPNAINGLIESRMELIICLNKVHNYRFDAVAQGVLTKLMAQKQRAEAQEMFIVPLLRKEIESILRSYLSGKGEPNLRVLGVGYGGQPFRALVESLGCKYYSFDISQGQSNSVDYIGYIDQDLPSDLLSEAPFDFLLCTEVLEHVADRFTAFENFQLLTQESGHLLITCPHFFQLHGAPHDYWRATPHAFRLFCSEVWI